MDNRSGLYFSGISLPLLFNRGTYLLSAGHEVQTRTRDTMIAHGMSVFVFFLFGGKSLIAHAGIRRGIGLTGHSHADLVGNLLRGVASISLTRQSTLVSESSN